MKYTPPALQSAPSPAVAHGGNHATSLNAGNPRTRVAPQDRAALLQRGGLGRGLDVPHIDEICCISQALVYSDATGIDITKFLLSNLGAYSLQRAL